MGGDPANGGRIWTSDSEAKVWRKSASMPQGSAIYRPTAFTKENKVDFFIVDYVITSVHYFRST